MSTMKSAQTVYYGPSSTTYPSAGSVSKGEAITALWTESTWCYIEYSVTGSSNKKRGYVPTNTINLTESVSAFSGTNSGMRYVQAADCPVYFGPNAITYPTCGSLSFREEVQYLGVKANNPSFAFIEYDVTGSTKKKRAWVYANNLATALPETTGVAIYTEGTKINSAGDYWHITQGWNGKNGHLGLDIIRHNASDTKIEGAEVYAIAPGTIVARNYNSANGNAVVIEHTTADGKTYYSMYGHLKQSYDKTTVAKNEAIGIMGNEGLQSQGEHLHLGISKDKVGTGFWGYARNSAGNKVTFTETKPGCKVFDSKQFYNPTKYFSQGDTFISDNYS